MLFPFMTNVNGVWETLRNLEIIANTKKSRFHQVIIETRWSHPSLVFLEHLSGINCISPLKSQCFKAMNGGLNL